MNMGFMLWFPDLAPEGCVMQLAEASIEIICMELSLVDPLLLD